MTSTGIANILMPTATVANAKQTSAKDASGGDFRQMMQMQKSSAYFFIILRSSLFSLFERLKYINPCLTVEYCDKVDTKMSAEDAETVKKMFEGKSA